MKALIIGTGAVGCAVAIATINGGMETALLARKKTADYLREHGLKRTGIFGDITFSADRFTVYEDYDKIPSSYDYVIVAVKTLANEEVARELNTYSDILGQTGRIVIFQNGWGNDVPFLEYFPSRQVFNARIITGFERVAPGVTNVTVHTAPILLGSLHGVSADELKPLVQVIRDSGIPSQISGELEEALWAKMLYNTTLNPLGAILNMSYGQLSSSQYLVSIMNCMIEVHLRLLMLLDIRLFGKMLRSIRMCFIVS